MNTNCFGRSSGLPIFCAFPPVKAVACLQKWPHSHATKGLQQRGLLRNLTGIPYYENDLWSFSTNAWQRYMKKIVYLSFYDLG
jgi:hypothetical protein